MYIKTHAFPLNILNYYSLITITFIHIPLHSNSKPHSFSLLHSFKDFLSLQLSNPPTSPKCIPTPSSPSSLPPLASSLPALPLLAPSSGPTPTAASATSRPEPARTNGLLSSLVLRLVERSASLLEICARPTLWRRAVPTAATPRPAGVSAAPSKASMLFYHGHF